MPRAASPDAGRTLAVKLLLLTDLHLTAKGERIIGLGPWERFEAVLDRALLDHADAAALAILGDLAHRGEPEVYARLARRLASLPIPLIPMLGNHERRAAFQAAFPEAATTPEGHVQAVLDTPHVRAIALDTLDGPPHVEGRHAGRLCEARTRWLDRALETRGGRMPLVLTHHPHVPVGFPGMDAIRLADGDELLRRLAPHGAHLVFGHIHRTISGSALGVPFTSLKSTCHQMPMDMADGRTTLSVDEPGAYGLALLGPGQVTVHTEDVAARPPAAEDPGSA